MKYSKYQKKILKTIKDDDCNIIISAVAGSGKTTTIEHCLKIIPPRRQTIFLAFNNTIVKELEERIKTEGVEITTMHSFCWKNLMRHYNYKVKLNKNKAKKYIKSILEKFSIPEEKYALYMFVLSNMCDLVRQNLIDIKDRKAIECLAVKYDYFMELRDIQMLFVLIKRMDADKEEFDFTDMIYRVIKDGVILPKYDFIFVDESQDLSKYQQIIISKIRKRKGRMIAVGDPAQAIYGFAGSDNNAYNDLRNLFDNTIELPLSVNYRCGKTIVKEAQKINNQIEPFKGAIDGEVRTGFVDEIKNGDWVLCRNLKPLVQMNMYFLSNHRKSFIKGIEIGMNLSAMVKKTGKKTIDGVRNELVTNIEKEKSKLRKLGVKNPNKVEKIDNMNQKLDIVKILSDDLNITKELLDRIKEIFKKQGDGICLSTIHKSKGLENDNIFILCPELIPNQFATQSWQLEQEFNLLYVAITRARKKLIYIDKKSFKEVQLFLKKHLNVSCNKSEEND